MDATLIYVTASSRDEAIQLARSLVAERLVACANVIDGASSIYWWQGAIQEESEALMIAKTRSASVEAVIDHVKAKHSYACPCVVALPITAGNKTYLEWIAAETRVA